MIRRALAAAVLLAPLVFAAQARAKGKVLLVPDDFATIQAAVDEAAPGDTVVVSAGTYPETVLVQDKTLRIEVPVEDFATIDAAGHDYGVKVVGGKGHVLVGLKIINAALDGILLESTVGSRVSDCYVVGSGAGSSSVQNGIHVDRGTKVEIEACLVEDVGNVGILLYHLQVDENDPAGGAVKSRVRDCDVVNTGNVGILVNGTKNLIDENTITGSQSDALELQPEASKNTVRDNTADGNRQGFRDYGTKNTWINCVAKNSGDDGWEVESSGSKFLKCRSENSAGSGLNVEDVATGNQFVSFGVTAAGDDAEFDHGIEVRGSRNKFTKCTVQTAGADGFHVTGDGNSFAKSSSTAAGRDGFHVESNDNKLAGCSASGSAGFDLFINAESTGNKVKGGSFTTRN
jgi:hypothetical protein